MSLNVGKLIDVGGAMMMMDILIDVMSRMVDIMAAQQLGLPER